MFMLEMSWTSGSRLGMSEKADSKAQSEKSKQVWTLEAQQSPRMVSNDTSGSASAGRADNKVFVKCLCEKQIDSWISSIILQN